MLTFSSKRVKNRKKKVLSKKQAISESSQMSGQGLCKIYNKKGCIAVYRKTSKIGCPLLVKEIKTKLPKLEIGAVKFKEEKDISKALEDIKKKTCRFLHSMKEKRAEGKTTHS